ncbi:MAG: CBS domain-containing protein [Oligoflexia bacterium]|nr:CBS domain-containing protein [Oligoflexia bacterium]
MAFPKMPDIASVMTPVPHFVGPETSLAEAVRIMYAQEIRHLPVCQAGRVLGLLSDRDAKLAQAVLKGRLDESKLTVADVCNADPYVVSPDERLDRVVAHMYKNHIGSSVVVRRDKLVGIFTVSDVCREMTDLLRRHYPDA